MSVAASVPPGVCPNCGSRLVLKANHGDDGVVVRNKFLRLQADGAVIGCPQNGCGVELRVKSGGRLLLFRRRRER